MAAGLSPFFPALPILFIIAIILLILPIPGFVRGRNVAVLSYIAWVLMGNIAYLVNMLVWRGNVVDVAPIYCDIASFFLACLPVGIACSLVCVNKLVWNISRSMTLTIGDDPRRNRIDLAICLVIPLLFGGLHVLVQDQRFTIVEDAGCFPSMDQSLPSLIIYCLPPSLICCCIASVYCVLSVFNFVSNRHRTSTLLPETTITAMTFNRYLRLTLLCTTSVVFCAVFLVGILVLRIQIGFLSWGSWATSSWDFSHVQVLTREDVNALPHFKSLLLSQLFPLPILGFHFFLFFGFGGEAIRHYKRTITAVTEVPQRMFPREQQEYPLEPSRVSTITGYPVLSMTRQDVPWRNFHLPRPSQQLSHPIPPPITVPPPARIFNRPVVISSPSAPLPSPQFSFSRASSRSSTVSLGMTMGHFPEPPWHFFDEAPPSALPSSIPAIGAPEVSTASTRSRFSLYSDKSPVQERQERRYTKLFVMGRRPSNPV